jgi:hypothetical protein
MRAFVCLLVLCLVNAPAFAVEPLRGSTPLPPTGKSAKDIQEITERVAFWRATCLQDWDAATHMTRKEWQTTCERVAVERRIFLLQDLDSFTMGGKSGRR